MVVQKKLYTVEDFEEYITRPENRDRRFELVYGTIIEKSHAELQGVILGNITAPLWNFAKTHKLGRTGVKVRHGLKRDKHNDRIPDISFTSTERADEVVKKGAVPHMPDLAIEVQSPDDSPREMREKAAYYLQNGSRLVWLAYNDKSIEECTLGEDGEMKLTPYGLDDVLNGGDLLPGFELAVRNIFDME